MNSATDSSLEDRVLFLVEEISLGEKEPSAEQSRVFNSFDMAMRYLQNLKEDAESLSAWRDSRLEQSRYIIRQYRFDNTDHPLQCMHAWEFTIDCQLLREEPEVIKSPRMEMFSVGDLVEVLSRIDEPSSPFIHRMYGVIVGKVSEAPLEPMPIYNLYTIHKHGHLVEMKVSAQCLRKVGLPLPSSLLFLQVYSEHLRGVHSLPESVTKYIRPGDTSVLVANVVSFDFETCTVRPPFEPQ